MALEVVRTKSKHVLVSPDYTRRFVFKILDTELAVVDEFLGERVLERTACSVEKARVKYRNLLRIGYAAW